LLALNTQLEPSPYVAQPVPFGPRGTGTAEIASPNASTIWLAVAMWCTVIAVRPARMLLRI
jgi:hypothetical protein